MTNDSFDALIQDSATIESELATKGITNGTILFDTLLSKTNTTTRFIKATVTKNNEI